MSVVVPLFLIAPLVLVPLGYRLLEVAAPGSRPPEFALRGVVPAAGLLVVSFWLPAGPVAAVLALPWVAVTGLTALVAGLRLLHDPDRLHPSVRHATDAAVAFLAIGATFALTDRLGARPFDFPSTIILLTAVHFHFAGFVLPLAGGLAYGRRPSRWLEGAIGAVVLGIPITALGFLGLPFANWIGAVLTAIGAFGIGLATILVARSLTGRPAVALAILAGASLLITMPMAIVYATETLIGVAWLDIDTMARVHGGLNALGFALPVIIAWTLERRALEVTPPGTRPTRDPRRLGLGAAAIIAGYALVVAGISAGIIGNLVDDQIGPPEAVPRPVFLAALFMLPAAIAAIGAIRRSRPLFIAGGFLCVGQSVIAFSGITLPFLVPGFLLLTLGAGGREETTPARAVVGGLAVVLLGIAAWVAPFTLTETTCWVARIGSDGATVYAQTPATDTFTLGPSEVAAGCDGGQISIQGAGIAAVLGIGAVAMAALSSMPPSTDRSALGEPAR
jgi:hypothetical protein